MQDFLKPDRIVVGSTDQAAAIKVSLAVPRRRRAGHRHRPGVGGDDQVRRQRLPGHQALVRQRRRRDLRGRRRRRQRRRARPGLRQAHRPGLPPPRPRLGRQLLPQGHAGAAEDRRPTPGYSLRPARGRRRRQRRAVRPGRRDKIVRRRRRRPRRQGDRRVGADVQGPHRRPARVAVAGDHRPPARRAGATVRAHDPTVDGPEGRAARRPSRSAPTRTPSRGRRRARRAHRVGRLPLARPGKVADDDAAAGPSSTPATCSTAASGVEPGFAYQGIGR